MAIKWKNNRKTNLKETNIKEIDVNCRENVTTKKKVQEERKPTVWLGLLLVLISVLCVSVVSYKASPKLQDIREAAIEEWEEQLADSRGKNIIQINQLSDLEKMSLVSNMYYLDYKLAYMYEGIDAKEYLLRGNKEYKEISEKQKDIYEDKAMEYMNVLYSMYCMDYSVNGASTHTYIEDTENFNGTGETVLAGLIESKDFEEFYDIYQGFLILQFDGNGDVSIVANHYVDGGNFPSYVSNIKLPAVAEYFMHQDIPVLDIREAEYNTETYYEYGTETTDVGETTIEETTAEGVDTDSYSTEDVYIYPDENMEEDTEKTVEMNTYPTEDVEEITVETTENGVSVETIAIPIEETEETIRSVMETATPQKINIDFPKIKNKNIIIGFQYPGYSMMYNNHDDVYEMTYFLVLLMGIVLFFVAVVLQNIKVFGLKELSIFKIPTEILIIIGSVLLILFLDSGLPYYLVMDLKEDIHYWLEQFHQPDLEVLMAGTVWIAFYGGVYFLIANCLPYIFHPVKSIVENSIVFRSILWIFRKCKKLFLYLTTIEAEKGIKNNVLKIVALNFVIISLCCCGWFVGIAGVIIYSIILYLILVKKADKLKKQYDAVLSMTKDMAEGKLDVTEEEDLGIFEPVKQELMKVRQGFSHAVEEEVRSRNMKTELITNVSHDLKTPLTAIITYVNLLKEEGLSEETRREYVETLDKKSQRLKVLIEDLFEVSKATSNNITLHYADMDIVNLVKQVRLENEEQIANSSIAFRWELPEEKCMLRLDPQKTYRIIENLIVNALKYSMEGSRVYVQLEQTETEVTFTIKNISATELNLEPEKLTERFVRGDVSRNTEGSGLGLAIVQSFTEVQAGKFAIEIDGDLFKAIVKFTK